MSVGDLGPNRHTAAAEADLQRRERRMTYVYLALFCLVTLTLAFFWYDRTAGERTCKRWMKTGEPALKAITMKLDSRWQSGEVTCDDEQAIRYFESCLSVNGFQLTYGDDTFCYSRQCVVVLRFADETEYRLPGPCEISTKGLSIALPSQDHLPLRDDSSQEPLPDGWKHAINALLGPGTVE